MSTAANVALEKQSHPERFCAFPRSVAHREVGPYHRPSRTGWPLPGAPAWTYSAPGRKFWYGNPRTNFSYDSGDT